MEEAVKWFTMSAERNNARAQIALGDIYYRGVGVKEDMQKALQYYTAASLNGDPLASYRVSIMYKTGVGTEKNLERYLEFLRMAVEGGNMEGLLESRMCGDHP
jgi:TPR repeat protein